MATKKISDLFKLSQLSEDDEFVVVDKSTTEKVLHSLGGRTTKVTFKDLKEAVGTSNHKVVILTRKMDLKQKVAN